MSKYFLKISYRCTIQKYNKSYLEMNKKRKEERRGRNRTIGVNLEERNISTW